jgi:hypothetical protein
MPRTLRVKSINKILVDFTPLSGTRGSKREEGIVLGEGKNREEPIREGKKQNLRWSGIFINWSKQNKCRLRNIAFNKIWTCH